MKIPHIQGAANKTKLEWTEPNEEPAMHAMRLRCTPHTKEFEREEGAKLFELFGYRGSYNAFLKSRNYPASTINSPMPTRQQETLEEEGLFSNSQSETVATGDGMSTANPTDANAGTPVALGPPQIARYDDHSTKGTLPACAGDLSHARCMHYPDAIHTAENNNSDNEMHVQSPNAATKRRQQSQDESSESEDSVILLEEDGQWRQRTMLFFVQPIIAMEDIKRFISAHVDPTNWLHRGLEMCSYKENDGYLHERVIRLTNTHDVIKELEIQFTDITTVMTHNFTATSVNPDDPGIIPQAADEKAEERAKDMMIMQLKGSCPKNDQAIEFLARTISTSSTVHGITETFMNFLFSSNPQQPLAPNASA